MSPQSAVITWPKTFPASVTGLDIRHHALLEASAGTGKTYAIEHLVLRLLLEDATPGGIKPEEILLLSFTEKTAADLRKRIRERLHQEWAGDNRAHWTTEQRARLHRAWLHADDLAIHTLHGFCHAALLRDPIANNALLRPEVLDDRTTAHEALENLLRGAWARDPHRLSLLREALNIKAGDWWRAKLIGLALAFQQGRGDVLDPPRDPGRVEALERDAALQSQILLDAVDTIRKSTFTIETFRESFATKTQQKERKSHAFEMVFNVTESSGFGKLDAADKCEILTTHFAGMRSNAKAVNHGFHSQLRPGSESLNEWKRLAEACDALRRISEDLGEARRLRKLGLLAEAATELRAELAREKRRRGGISYDDMTQNLADAILRTPELASRLRRTYKVCIVDEFQDTDLQQWSILQALCLDADKGSDTKTEPPMPLFLVGDPKQAIYSFRGGDLKTYLAARDRLRRLAEAEPPRAQGIGLTENFRSRPALIESLNAVFEHPDWFGASNSGSPTGAWRLSESREIVFTRVRAGAATSPPTTTTNLPVLRVRDFRPESPDKALSKRKVERKLREWIATRILDLTSGQTDLSIVPKHETKARAPRFGDIAVLVRRHSEADALERLLRQQGIPCRVRRTGGVFHGEGADALRLLLDLMPSAAHADTQARILLLPFLRRTGSDWPEGRPLSPPPLLLRWMELAQAGRWPEFFDAVLRDSGHLSRVSMESESAAARLLALGRALGEAGSTPGTSIRTLADRFDALRRGEGEGDEGVIEEEAGEDDEGPGVRQEVGAVTVMTLHMSKGLEFPVVFVAATGEGKRPDFFTVREENGFRHVLDKDDAEAASRHQNQLREEDKRLFYVAFTRARDCLYVPLLPAAKGNTKYGPLGDFAADALSSLLDVPGQTLVLPDVTEVPPLRRNAGTTAIGALSVSKTARASASKSADETDALFARLRRLNSYSALAKRAAPERESLAEGGGGKARTDELLGDDGKRTLRDETVTPHEDTTVVSVADIQPPTRAAGITREELPAGAAAGNVLHSLLEVTDFSTARNTDTPAAWLELAGQRERIEGLLRREGLSPVHVDAVARAVWNTLRMPLPDPARPGATIRLADNASHMHEVEFLFPIVPGNGIALEGVERRGNFLWGFIDLVFRHEGRYYLLDWKSNLLDAYDAVTVEAAMKVSGYDLQWQLYAVALDRWLDARLPDYDPARDFGGIVYAYMRGAALDGFSGYSYKPTTEELRSTYPDRVKRLLGITGGAA